MRFLTVIGAIAAIGFAGLFALANFVQPRPREMVVTIPAQRLKAQPVETTAARNPKTAETEAAAGTPSAQ